MGQTNSDKILQSVLENPQFVERSHYRLQGNETVDSLLFGDDENLFARTVATIIRGKEEQKSEKEIYNEIINYLRLKV